MAEKTLPEFSILVCGQTGVGKSSLVNFILGKDVCAVGDPGEEDEDDIESSFDRKTTEVSKQGLTINGVHLSIYDSPGLQDGTADEPKYLADMLNNCSDVDLVFYCHDMLADRWTDHEVKSVRLLTETFGSTFWDKTILILTKANMLQTRQRSTQEELAKYFLVKKTKIMKRFLFELRKQAESVKDLPVVVAGSEGEQFLADGKHFIGNVWVTCLERLASSKPYKVELFLKATGAASRIVSCSDIRGEGSSGFWPTREDMVKAWEVMSGRRKALKSDSVQATTTTVCKYIGVGTDFNVGVLW